MKEKYACNVATLYVTQATQSSNVDVLTMKMKNKNMKSFQFVITSPH